MQSNKPIHVFQKNALEKVYIEIQKYKGNLVIDIRVYYLVLGTTNEWKRSNEKGLCLSVDKLDDLLGGLKMAKKRLHKQTKKRKQTTILPYVNAR